MRKISKQFDAKLLLHSFGIEFAVESFPGMSVSLKNKGTGYGTLAGWGISSFDSVQPHMRHVIHPISMINNWKDTFKALNLASLKREVVLTFSEVLILKPCHLIRRYKHVFLNVTFQ